MMIVNVNEFLFILKYSMQIALVQKHTAEKQLSNAILFRPIEFGQVQ